MKNAHFWIGVSLAMGEWSLLDLIAGEQPFENGCFVAFHTLLIIFWWSQRLRELKEKKGTP